MAFKDLTKKKIFFYFFKQKKSVCVSDVRNYIEIQFNKFYVNASLRYFDPLSFSQ